MRFVMQVGLSLNLVVFRINPMSKCPASNNVFCNFPQPYQNLTTPLVSKLVLLRSPRLTRSVARRGKARGFSFTLYVSLSDFFFVCATDVFGIGMTLLICQRMSCKNITSPPGNLSPPGSDQGGGWTTPFLYFASKNGHKSNRHSGHFRG